MSGNVTHGDFSIEKMQARVNLLAKVNDVEPIQLEKDPDAKGEAMFTEELGDFVVENGGCFNWIMIGCEKLLLKSHSMVEKQSRRFTNMTKDYDDAELRMLELAMTAVVECGMPFEQVVKQFKTSVAEYREKAEQSAMQVEGEVK